MAEKSSRSARSWTEIQLDFAFLSDAGAVADSTPGRETQGTHFQAKRPERKGRSLATAIATARSELLEAPLDEVSAQLLPLLEFCEAALTRALDIVSLHATEAPFSAEEYRSLRGIGQAQWLLAEKQSQQEERQAVRETQRRQKKGAEFRIRESE